MSQDSLRKIFLGCFILQSKSDVHVNAILYNISVEPTRSYLKETVSHFVNELGVREFGKTWILHVDDRSVHSLLIYTLNFSWTIYLCTALFYGMIGINDHVKRYSLFLFTRNS